MTAIGLTPINHPPPPSSSNYEGNTVLPMATKAKQPASSTFFDDESRAKRYSEIEFVLATARISFDSEIGWVEGIVHETKTSQKETEMLLVHPSPPPPTATPESKPDTVSDNIDANNLQSHRPEALRVFINSADFIRFVFTINQHIKISLKGGRTIRELGPYGSGILPFSLVFSSGLAIQYMRGGISIPEGTVIDTWQDHNNQGDFSSFELSTSKLSAASPARTSPHKSSPKLTQLSFWDQPGTQNPDKSISIGHDFNDLTIYPALNSLTEGMMTPLLGIVESVKTPSTTSTGALCVSLTLADASSYSTKRGFRLTCFSSKSRLARDLPTPFSGDAILLKSVKIDKWAGGLIGTVDQTKLDWIVYERKADGIILPKHAKSDGGREGASVDVDVFYADAEERKELFRQFVAAVEAGPWADETWGA